MRILTYFFILRLCITPGLETSNWLNSLVTYIKQDNIQLYQVLLLFDGLSVRSEVLKVEDIVQGISRKVPAMKIGFQEATIDKAHELSQSTSFYNPRTTIIVIIHSSIVNACMSQLNQTLTFVSQVSKARRRPRCLIILQEEEERFAYLGILKRMWSNQFLDVTILELEKPKRNDYFSNMAPEIVIHQLNPFTNRYDKFKYSKMTDWFPEKTHNLQGLTMKVALFQYPPSVSIERNTTGHAAKLQGQDIKLTKAISKRLNYKVDWVTPKADSWGVGSCQKSNKSCILHGLMNNKIQYVGNTVGILGPCEESLHDWSGSMELFGVVLVVPIFAKKSVLVLNMWKIANLFMLVGVFLSTWLITRILPFQTRNWKLLQIVRIVLAIATPHEPRQTAERILFGAMLFACLFHSSVIYTALTDMSLHTETEPELKTTTDLLHSSLEPIVPKAYYSSLVKNTRGSGRLLLEKAKKVNGTSQECLRRLVKKMNVACISRSDTAEFLIQNNRDSCGRPRIKVLEDPLSTIPSGIVMEARSPYVERFNKELLRLVQSGITSKWKQERVNQTSRSVDVAGDCTEREAESVHLEGQVMYVLIFGYTCATISFACEVIGSYFSKKVNYE